MRNVIKKQLSEYNLIATSFHESGHTVVGLYNYWKVAKVEIYKPDFNEACTHYDDYEGATEDNKLATDFIIFDLQATYAGLLAERMYYKDISGSDMLPMHLRIGSSADIKNASSQIRKFKLAAPGKATQLLKKQIQNTASKILIEHWADVKMIAHKLYEKQSLTFDELKFILTRKTENKDFWKDRFKKIKIIHALIPPDEDEVRKLIKS